MKFHVEGAHRVTGLSMKTVIDAPDEAAAMDVASQMDLLISRIRPESGQVVQTDEAVKVEVRCLQCSNILEFESRYAGQFGHCPVCDCPITVPSIKESEFKKGRRNNASQWGAIAAVPFLLLILPGDPWFVALKHFLLPIGGVLVCVWLYKLAGSRY